MREQIQAIVTVLSLVNPAICGAMFAHIEGNHSRSQRVVDATKAVLATMAILAVSALIGTQLLHVFGVSLDAFMVAGGGVLAWMGFSMLSGQATPPTSGDAPADTGASLAPLVLFAASPGTITGVITSLRRPHRFGSSRYGSGGNRRSKSRDLARLIARLTGLRQGQRGRVGA